MQVKILSAAHLLLILSAAEARSLGIRSHSGCAVLLNTKTSSFSYPFCRRKRYRVRTQTQTYLLSSCTAMMDLIARLQQLPVSLPACRLYAVNHCYAVSFRPGCRYFFLLRYLCSEYGTRTGITDLAAAWYREHCRLLSCDIVNDLGPHLSSDGADAQ